MDKKRFILLCIAFCLLLSACGGGEEAQTGFTFTDHLGRTVTVEQPQRFASLLGSYAQICQLAGAYVCAAPDDAWEDLQLDMPEDAVNLGSIQKLSLELLMASQPDLVLASASRGQHTQWLDTLEAAGIPVAYFTVDDFDDYLELLALCTRFTGREDLYDRHGTQVQAQIQEVIARSELRLQGGEGPSVLCMTASASTLRAQNSVGTVLGAMLKTLGCRNIADSDEMLLEDLSVEQILLSDPDYIFIVQRGDDLEGMQEHVRSFLTEHPAWAELTAVKAGRVYYMDKNLFNLKPNHRWGEAYGMVEEILENG